ncbi:16S rRNA (uracil(1498)-N(3))-methyltransferase [Blastopirellula sp. JC732]|uniref:Ribosomal RNA small subunit methyltransferase E n=1 Tax=Blastopirellula sediminis TaxID=2894196 RepID=A0A9X1MNB3_9BACT|nr:16S rRNA (uracil(1498)-N(3))-methyltransferase [Blastopirellula sediminis]MCC9607275.1 16S rRNA (uracil(1498)-N(3))-methyltransferase [Blastopirellula sediminis]MCC9629432.1 16S rRNA (uracil(1498)-N(3))-methyltransferase [Blastopirellula sediminis]
MSHRFFLEAPITAETVDIEGPEAHHLLHVMRAKIGDKVTLFDDSGAQFAAEIIAVGRKSATARILERQEVSRELPVSLTIAAALPKGDRQRWLVEKCVELGVTDLVPLETERSGSLKKEKSLDKLRGYVIDASKQCERNRLMRIGESASLPSFWEASPSALRLIADPVAQEAVSDLLPSVPTDVIIAVGPEGGFSPAEYEAALAAGWRGFRLGKRILRIETAALAAAAAVAAAYDQLDPDAA